MLLQPLTGSIADIAASIFGLFYLGFLPSHWLQLRNLDAPALAPSLSALSPEWSWVTSGLAITLSGCLMIVASDIGSWAVGRQFGRRPLSPISPGKTLEGALGGLLASMLVGGLSALLLGWPGWGIPGLLLGALVALIALVGDLTESMMKRDAGVKDSGDVLPGHGGILDRIDSYLFTPAVLYTSWLFCFLCSARLELPQSGVTWAWPARTSRPAERVACSMQMLSSIGKGVAVST